MSRHNKRRCLETGAHGVAEQCDRFVTHAVHSQSPDMNQTEHEEIGRYCEWRNIFPMESLSINNNLSSLINF